MIKVDPCQVKNTRIWLVDSQCMGANLKFVGMICTNILYLFR